jgi:hypothetical protein
LLVAFLVYSSILKMEVVRSSETSIDFCRATQCPIPGDSNLHQDILCGTNQNVLEWIIVFVFYPHGWYARDSVLRGRAMAEAVSRWLLTAAAGFNPGSGQVGFVVDKVAPGQVFSEYFGFPCHLFHQILHPHNHPGQVQ